MAKSRFTLMRPHCAGIDLGSEAHYVAIPEDSGPDEVRRFGCFTCDLNEMADWLKAHKVTDIAMESTGVYWIPVYEALASHGFNVVLVDARLAKALPGRKTDVQDCQWIRDLHMYGLLQSCVVPEAAILAVRSYWRQRGRLVGQRAEQLQLMQKALEQMNVQIHKVLSEMSGASAQAMIRAILKGERRPKVLSSLLVGTAVKKKDLVEKALEGRWSEHHLFALEQAVQMFDFLDAQIAECDRMMDQKLSELGGAEPGGKGPSGASHNAPKFDAVAHLKKLTGVDPTTIDGISGNIASTLLTELGLDLSRFRTAKHFVSYLGLASSNAITGGKIKRGNTRKVKHRASVAFRMGAQSLHSSMSALGANLRRLSARIGKAKANTAIARKIAIQYYNLMTTKTPFKDQGADAYDQKFREAKIRSVQKQARKLGFQLIERPVLVGGT